MRIRVAFPRSCFPRFAEMGSGLGYLQRRQSFAGVRAVRRCPDATAAVIIGLRVSAPLGPSTPPVASPAQLKPNSDHVVCGVE